ncbi:MAG: type II toxin-antitoxin system YafQ family toxin [Paludibacteraceae bacterium]|nr:type II toxin-antitoxin system YafQ family toxin [Paludibacteraceae bacterium]
MYTVRTTQEFDRDVKRCKKQGRNMALLKEVVDQLLEDGVLPDEYKPHMLRDEYAGLWECHIEDDWLLIWRQNDFKLTLLFTNTGSHKYLFGKKGE